MTSSRWAGQSEMCWIWVYLVRPATTWEMRPGSGAGPGVPATGLRSPARTRLRVIWRAPSSRVYGPWPSVRWSGAHGGWLVGCTSAWNAGSQTPVGGTVIAYPPPPVGPAGSYRGDLHLHTVHSDGQRDPSELVTAAHASGLNFIVSTDHNTNAANRVWPVCRTGALLVIPGEEVTTRHGHWLAVGLSPHAGLGLALRAARRCVPRFAEGSSARSRRLGGRRPSGRAGAGIGVGVRFRSMRTRSRYGTAGANLSPTNCRRFYFGSGCCVRAGASRRSVAATPTPKARRSVRRRRSCTRVNYRYR